jgi:type IV pilus assembly protein PilE
MIELMVVVVIVGILAAIAIPIYGKYIKTSRVTEATGRIGEIVTAAKAFGQEHQNDNGVAVWPAAADTGGVFSLRSTPNFTYTISQGAGGLGTQPFAITATGRRQMAGATVVVSLTNINANGTPPQITGL